MRFAFVIRLGKQTRPAEGLFEGWVEEVDTATEWRFRSAEELLKFLGQRFDLAMASADEARENDRNDHSYSTKKSICKERKSS